MIIELFFNFKLHFLSLKKQQPKHLSVCQERKNLRQIREKERQTDRQTEQEREKERGRRGEGEGGRGREKERERCEM